MGWDGMGMGDDEGMYVRGHLAPVMSFLRKNGLGNYLF